MSISRTNIKMAVRVLLALAAVAVVAAAAPYNPEVDFGVPPPRERRSGAPWNYEGSG